MAVTRPSDIFAVSLVADAIDARRYNRTGRLLNSPYIVDRTGQIEPNKSGKTIDFPYVKDTSGNAGVQTWSGSALTSDKLEITSEQASVVQSAVNFTNDFAALKLIQNSANPEALMAEFVVKKMQEKVVTAIYAAIEADVTESDISHASAPVAGNFLTASIADRYATLAFGDTMNSDEVPPLVIAHSHVMYDVKNDTKVQTSLQYAGRNITEAPWLDIAGYNFFQSDLVTAGDSGDGAIRDYTSYILKAGAVQIYLNVHDELFGDTVRAANTLDMNTVFPFEYAVCITPSAVTPVAAVIANSSLNA